VHIVEHCLECGSVLHAWWLKIPKAIDHTFLDVLWCQWWLLFITDSPYLLLLQPTHGKSKSSKHLTYMSKNIEFDFWNNLHRIVDFDMFIFKATCASVMRSEGGIASKASIFNSDDERAQRSTAGKSQGRQLTGRSCRLSCWWRKMTHGLVACRANDERAQRSTTSKSQGRRTSSRYCRLPCSGKEGSASKTATLLHGRDLGALCPRALFKVPLNTPF
jgi:hypothetical protein